LVTNNVYLEGITNSKITIGGGPQTGGTNIGNGDNYAVGVATFSDNIVANAHATGAGIAVGKGFLGTVVEKNIIFNWGPAGQEIQNYSGGSIIDSGNTKDALGSNSGGLKEPFPNPYQLKAVGNSSNTGTNGVDGYYAHIGNPGGFPSTSVGFLSAVRQQSKANWNPALMAAAANNYVRAGFGVISSTSTPIASPTTTTTSASVSANTPVQVSVTVNSPANGATFNGQSDVNIAVSATGGGSIASLAVTADGNILKTCLKASSCSVTWQWKKISEGTHTVGGHGSDTTGHTSSASVTIAKF
jgi:hypothetical protein